MGRRVADRPVDSLTASTDKPYVGRRVALVPSAVPSAKTPETSPGTVQPNFTLSGDTALLEAPAPRHLAADTAEVERILEALEPVDQTTSFDSEDTAVLPLLKAERTRSAPGKRRAVKHAGSRGPLFKSLPSAPVLLGVAALAVSIGGVLSAAEPGTVSNDGRGVAPPSALTGTAGVGKVGGDLDQDRGEVVSRDSARDAQSDAAGEDLQEAAEGMAQDRNTALRELASAAETQSKIIAQNLWRYPTSPVSLTARFGEYGLWSNYHTGLDFNGNTGDPIFAVANGVVTSAGYDGSYGNKTVVQLEDGTEIWYCHQNSYAVSVGDVVRGGEVIGTIGATGNVTGSHLHLEVRPGGGDPVDPYLAMQQNGLF